MPDTTLGIEYSTWDDFKRDLEKRLGRFLNVDHWLRIKPKKPLPWNSYDLQCALEEFRKSRELFDSRRN